ncbi:MAG: response regulator transcription factor [Chloroflexia bacterium]|nr:response regulator transcription factor [Chloroflexia bacterium]
MTAPEANDAALTVLLVEDEETIVEFLTMGLTYEGFTVHVVRDGRDALPAFERVHPHLVLLDIMLPGMDGLQVCRTIRAESNVPVLLLSARGEEFDRVLGLELGADDYLTKPFAMRELVARVKAMLRRAAMRLRDATDATSRGPIAHGEPFRFAANGLEVDRAERRATRDGQPVILKPKEFDLLCYFLRHPGIVLTREALLREVWGYEFPIDTRTVDVHIRGLRQKIEVDPSEPRLIETVRGYGYRFATRR